MSTGFVYDDVYLAHNTGPSHPERPDRLRAVTMALDETGLRDQLVAVEPRRATKEQIAAVHDRRYVERVFELTAEGQPWIDTVDCPICPESYDAALLAAGGLLAACDRVMAGEITNAFCAVRPPGHHAERDRAMGFCLFNNVAVAVEYLLKTHKLERVAIVDFDVHHCNGTQHTFDTRDDVLVVSLHEHPAFLYPGTGFDHETGSRAGDGFTLNVPMLPHSDDDTYAQAFDEKVLPKLDAFKPQFVLVSAGFDPVREDPLAHIDLSVDYVGRMTGQLAEAAGRLCGGKLVSVLEGGYHLESVVGCTISHVTALVEGR